MAVMLLPVLSQKNFLASQRRRATISALLDSLVDVNGVYAPQDG